MFSLALKRDCPGWHPRECGDL